MVVLGAVEVRTRNNLSCFHCCIRILPFPLPIDDEHHPKIHSAVLITIPLRCIPFTKTNHPRTYCCRMAKTSTKDPSVDPFSQRTTRNAARIVITVDPPATTSQRRPTTRNHSPFQRCTLFIIITTSAQKNENIAAQWPPPLLPPPQQPQHLDCGTSRCQYRTTIRTTTMANTTFTMPIIRITAIQPFPFMPSKGTESWLATRNPHRRRKIRLLLLLLLLPHNT